MEHTNKEVVNLMERYAENKALKAEIAEYQKTKLKTEHEKFRVGQVIEFTGGYYDQFRYQTEITGFDEDGDDLS